MDIEDIWRRKYRIILETPRFVLRPLIAEDMDWLTEILCDADVNRFLWSIAKPAEARRSAEAIVFLDMHRSHFGVWAIQDKQDGVIHGWTELSKLRPWSGSSDEIALSYVLKRASWGCGIATEAAGRLLRCAFEIHELERVMAVVFEGNKASKRVLKKLGMRYVKRARSADGRVLHYFRIDAPRAPVVRPVDGDSIDR